MNKLKVVSWNMDFWKSKHKDKGWEFINSQDPDISLLSECIDHPSKNFSINHISKNKWGTGVFSKHKIVEHELEFGNEQTLRVAHFQFMHELEMRKNVIFCFYMNWK